MYYWRDNKGHIYGPFSKQKDGFPNAGEIVRYYREKMKYTQIALALLLGVNRLQVIRMEHHNQVPKNIERRRAIADLLKIPPILLGIGVIGSYLEPLEEEHLHTPDSAYSVEEASEYLDAAWEINFYSGSSYLLPGARRWKARIEEKVEGGGPEQKKNLDLLHQYKHLLLVVGKQRQDYTETDPEGLINIARQLDNPDALGISLHRRGSMYFQQQNYEAALKDIRESLSQVAQAGPRVKGFVLAGSGPVLAHYATGKDDAQDVLDN